MWGDGEFWFDCGCDWWSYGCLWWFGGWDWYCIDCVCVKVDYLYLLLVW